MDGIMAVIPFHTVHSLYVEANKPPLDLRRITFLLQYKVKLKVNPDIPTFRCVFHPQFEDLHDKKIKIVQKQLTGN
jgi:hypothetical protein